MVKKIFAFVTKEIGGLHEAAYLIAFFTFLSQILGLVRDRALAHYFGASSILDVYYSSFRIPDLVFILVTTLVSSAVLIPLLSKNFENKVEFQKIIDSVFTIFLIFTLVLCVVIFIFTPQILKMILPGINDWENQKILIDFTRILLLSPFFLGISQLLGGIIQAYKRFFIYAISPILYNVGILIGVLYLYPLLGVYGLTYGVILGVILHLVIQLPFIMDKKHFPRITFNIKWKYIKEIIILSIPRAFALTSSQLTIIFLFGVSSTLMAGSIAILGFANNLQSVPLSIIGVSYSLAAFPTLSRLYANQKTQEFLEQVSNATKHIIFWSIPAIVLFVILRAQIVRTVLGTGEFSWSDTRLTAATMALFTFSVLAQSLILLFVRAYYAAGKTFKPVLYSIYSTLFTVILVFFFLSIYDNNMTFKFFLNGLLRVSDLEGTKILILPLAFSLGMILNTFIIWRAFEKDFGKISNIIKKTFWDSVFASLVLGYFTYSALQFFSDIFDLNTTLGIFAQGFFSGIIGIFFGFITLIVLGNNEIKEITKTLKNKVWKVKPIVPDQSEL
jgi:putative peptidoglycan lipid II flippase